MIWIPSYRIYVTDEHDVVSSENIIFNEKVGVEKGYTEIETALTEDYNEFSEGETESTEYQSLEVGSLDNDQVSDHHDFDDFESLFDSSKMNQPIARNLRNRQNLRAPQKLNDYVLNHVYERKTFTAMIGKIEDISVTEALKDDKWRRAMSEEFSSLMKMKTGT